MIIDEHSRLLSKTNCITIIIITCDGSKFTIAKNPNDPETFYEPNRKSSLGFNMLHTISLLDIPSKCYLDVVIQPGSKKNEFQAICDIIDRY